jgi:hypothetical protein
VYALGDLVTSAGVDYRSLTGGNVGHTPASSPTFWSVVNSGSAVGVNGFVATDVGRLIRLNSEPDLWAPAASYTTGNSVTFDGGYWTALKGNSGVQPGTDASTWEINPAAQTWTWGQITAITSANTVSVLVRGPALLYVTTIRTWRIGAYSDTTGWPSVGCYHQGRLWLAGSISNRVDSSISNQLFNFAPTAADGTVADNNAITAVFNASDVNTIYWMQPSALGIICGTVGGEWLIQASQLNDPLTPTSIQAHRVTKYRCANVEPRTTGLSIVFVQKEGRKMMEFLSDVFSSKFSAPNLSLTGKHLTKSGIAEIAYQEELTPIVWARTNDGRLIGCTYRRTSSFATEEPTFAGWHRHILGSNRLVESICVGSANGGGYDSLAMVTNDPSTGVRHVELLTTLFEQESAVTEAWFLDDAVTPSGAQVVGGTVVFYGLWHLNGKIASVWAGGLDCGDYLVTNGSVSVPFQSDPGRLFTKTYLEGLSNSGNTFNGFATFLDSYATVTPARSPSNATALAYIGPNIAFTGAATDFAIADWSNAKVYTYQHGSGTNLGIRRFNMGSGFEEVDVGNTLPVNPGFSLLQCKDSAGFLYSAATANNSGVLTKFNPTTLAVVAQFGVGGASFNVDSTHFVDCGYIVPAYANGNFIIAASPFSGVGGSSDSAIQVVNADTMAYAFSTYQNPDEDTAFDLVSGPQGSNSITYLKSAVPFDGTVIGLYSVSILGTDPFTLLPGAPAWTGPGANPYIFYERIGKVHPTTIDPNWVTFASCSTMVFDQADGNLIMGISAHQTSFRPDGSLPPTSFLVKLRAADGSLLWKVPVNGYPGRFLASTRVNGWFAMLSGTALPGFAFPVYVVDTIAGSWVEYDVPGVFATSGAQSFDSVTGRMLVNGQLSTGTAGSPKPIGPSPSAGWTNTWFMFQLGTVFFGATTSTQRDTIPAVVGFTYTTQGQLLRPAAREDTGSANGPGFGKTKRNHMFAVQLQDSQGVSFGTDFTKLHTAAFKTKGGTAYTPAQLFSGIYWNTIDSDYNFDSQLCWQVTRPYPCTVTALGGFINTQDR